MDLVDVYARGVVVAFLLGLGRLGLLLPELWSQRARNLSKVGLRFSYFVGNYVQGRPSMLSHALLALAYSLMLAPLASWLAVASATRTALLAWKGVHETPEHVKRYRHQLSLVSLPKAEVRRLTTEFMKASGIETFEISTPFTRVMPLKKRWFSGDRQFEYRIVGTTVERRLLDQESIGPPRSTLVKDNVLLERDLLLPDLPGSLEWHAVSRPLSYELLALHVDEVGEVEVRRHLRTEAERIRSGIPAVKAFCEARGLVWRETPVGADVQDPPGLSPEQTKELGDAYWKKLGELKLEGEEVRAYKERVAQLEHLLV